MKTNYKFYKFNSHIMPGFYSDNYINKEDFSVDSISHLDNSQPDQIAFAQNDQRAIELIIKRLRESKVKSIAYLEQCLKITYNLERVKSLNKLFNKKDELK